MDARLRILAHAAAAAAFFFLLQRFVLAASLNESILWAIAAGAGAAWLAYRQSIGRN